MGTMQRTLDTLVRDFVHRIEIHPDLPRETISRAAKHAATCAGCARSRRHRLALDRRSCRDTGRQTVPARRDCLFDVRCEVDDPVARPLHRCSSRHFSIRFRNAPSDIQEFVPDRRTPGGYTEPSSSVAFVSLCHQLVGHELSPIRFGQSLSHGYSLIVGHRVNAGSARLDLARVLRKFVLILTRPGRGLFHDIFERFRRHSLIIPQRPFSTTPIRGAKARRRSHQMASNECSTRRRSKPARLWSGRRESNPRMQLGKLPFYH
jgi:hypothetical protein